MKDVAPLGAQEGGHVAGAHTGYVRHIHQQLVHAHAPHHGAELPQKKYPSPLLGQTAGQAIGIADGDDGQLCFPPGMEGQAVSRALSWGESAHRRHPCPEREDRTQVQVTADRARGALHPVQGDARPGVGAGLGRQVPDAVTGLDVDLSRVQPLRAHPVQGVVKRLQLALGVGCVLRLQAV